MSRSEGPPHIWTQGERRQAIRMWTRTGHEFHDMCWPQIPCVEKALTLRQKATLKESHHVCLNHLLKNKTIVCRVCEKTIDSPSWSAHVDREDCRRGRVEGMLVEDSWFDSRFASVLHNGKWHFYMTLAKKEVMALVEKVYNINFIPPPPGIWYNNDCLRMLCAMATLDDYTTEQWVADARSDHVKCIRLVGLMRGLRAQNFLCGNHKIQGRKFTNRRMQPPDRHAGTATSSEIKKIENDKFAGWRLLMRSKNVVDERSILPEEPEYTQFMKHQEEAKRKIRSKKTEEEGDGGNREGDEDI